MNCTHDIKFLIGDKDGILCKNCGARFANFEEMSGKAEKPKRSKKKAEEDKSDEVR